MRRIHATILILAALLPMGVNAQLSIPYAEDFNTMADITGLTSQGYSYYGCTLSLYTSSNYSCDGTKNLKLSGGGTTKNRVLVFPAFSQDISNLTLVFNTRPEGTSINPGFLDIGYVTDASDTSTFVALATYHCLSFNNACQLKECRFASAPTGARIALRNRPKGSAYFWFVDDIEVLDTLNLCHWPTSVGMTAIDATSVTLAAADSTGSTSDFRLSLDGTDMGVFYNQTTLTNLSPGTIYTAVVQSVCGSTSAAYPVTYNFTTPCNSTRPAPFVDDMESHASGNAPECYTTVVRNDYGTTFYPRVIRNAANAHSDTGYLRLQGMCNVIALPTVSLSANNMHVRFHIRYSDTTSGTLRAGVLTTLGDTSTFVPFFTVPNHSTQYTEFEFWTDGLNVDTAYVTFFWSSRYAKAACFIDDITVEANTGCLRPNTTYFDSVDSTSVSLSWTEVPTHYEYQVGYGTNASVNSATIIGGITSNAYTVTGLTPATDYWFWVRTVCDDTTEWQPIGSIRTACLSGMTAPVAITFGTMPYGLLPLCWTAMHTPAYAGVQDEQYFGFGPVLQFNLGINATSIIAMPHIHLPANSMRVTVTAAIDSEDPASLELGYVTDLSSPASFVPMVNVTATTLTNYTFTTDTVNDDTLWIAFRSTSQASYLNYAYISSINVISIDGCVTPTDVVVSSTTDVSAIVRWHSTDATSYEVALAAVPDIDSSAIVFTSDTSVAITDLLPGSQYYVWVRANCGGTASEWTAATPFRTMCSEGYCTINIHIADNNYNGQLFSLARVAIVAIVGDEIAAIAGGTSAGGPVVDVSFPVCATDTVAFVWIDTNLYESYGIFSSICYSITLDNGTVLASGNGTDMTDGTVILITTAPCSNCQPPQGFSVRYITDNSIAVGWDPAANVDAWVTCLDGVVVDTVYDTLYTFYNLTVGTFYNLGVAALCSNGDNSQAATLTATTACANGECEIQIDMWSLLEYTILWGGGNAVEVYAGTSLRGSASVPNGQDAATAYIGVCDGDSITLQWHAGSNGFGSACAFAIIAPGNDTLYNGTGAMSDMQLATTTINCTGCLRPDSVTINSVATTSVTFSWEATGAQSYSLTVGDTTVTTTSNTITVTGLAPSTEYRYWLHSNCAGGSSLATAGRFNTACGPRPLPYNEGFETTPVGQLPVCWTNIGQYPDYMNTLTPSVYRSANMAHTGFNSLELMGSTSIHPMAVSMPLTGEPANNLAVSFWLDGTTYTGMEAGLMTNPTDSNSFVPLLLVPQVTPGPDFYYFSTANVTFSDSVYYFALRFRSNSILCGELYIDDLTVQRRPVCSDQFYHLGVTDVDQNSASASWTVSIGDNIGAFYTVCLLNAFGDLTDTFNTTDTALLLTGLPPATTYSLFVRLNCGGDVSAVSDTVTFTTSGAVPTPCLVPVFDSIATGEDFITIFYNSSSDSVELMLVEAGITITDTIIPAVSPFPIYNLTHSTTYSVSLRSLCPDGNMSEWVTSTAGTTVVDCGIPSSPILDAVDFTTATVSWNAAADEQAWNVNIYNTVYDQTYHSNTLSHTFSGLTPATTYNIRVQALCGMHGDIPGEWSEPLTVTTTTCQPVVGVTVSNISGNSATVGWTPIANGNGTWQVEYGLRGFSRGEGVSVTTTYNPHTITGLEPNTAYDIYVASVCAEGVLSTYSDSTGFTTSNAGISSTDAASFTLTPNPAGGDITVRVSEPSSLTVIDLQGRTVIATTPVSSTFIISHSSLSPGTYFVRMVNSRGTAVRKLIVK